MKRVVRHNARIRWMIALAVLCTLPLLGQSVPETRIENSALVQYNQLGGFPLSTASNLVSFVVKNIGKIHLQKTVFPVAALPGDTVTFRIVVGNEGTASLANVRMIDTLPAAVALLSVNHGFVQGSVVSETWSHLDAGSMDTLVIVARVLPSVTSGSLLINTAYGSDSSGTTIASSASVIAAKMPHFTFTGSAYPKPVRAGDTLTYSLHYGNDGNATGTGVRIYYAVPSGTRFVSASNNGQMTAGVVLWEIGNLSAGAFGDVQMKVNIPSGTANKSRILNMGLLNANGGVSISSNQDTTVVYRILADRVRLVPNPRLIIGNGIDKSTLSVTVTDAVGQVVPDGTPITLATTAGTFSNGLQTIVLSTIHGIATIFLTADIVSNQITAAIATATAGTVGVGTVTDLVTIVFYPGAITGKVLDNRTGSTVDGAIAEVRSNNGLIIGIDTTRTGNPYLVPIARTDTFRTRVTAIDAFGSATVSIASLFVAVPGVGGIPPSPNGSSISEAIYDLATGTRVANAGLLVSRFGPSGALVDTVRTNQIGNYVFNNVSAGNSTIELVRQTDTTRVSVGNLGGGEFAINANLGITTVRPELRLTKTASADTVMVGDSLRYVLRVQNFGNTVLTNVIIHDSIPASLTIVAVSGNALRSGNAVSATVGSMSSGAIDSVRITVRVRSDLPNRLTIINTASAESDQTPRENASRQIVTKVVVPDRSCRLGLRTTPSLVIGNGSNASVIEVFLSDTLGRPKPDGTSVTFSTTLGFFSNGKRTIILPTLNGRVVDSVRALILSGSIDTANVTVSAGDPEVCSASGTIMVTFYPGAISGVVHNRQVRQAGTNALVRVNTSAGQLIASVQTGDDGEYLIPVPKTDRYRVTITTTNAFGEISTATMDVMVIVPATGGNAPVSVNNQIRGSVFYIVSHRPVPAAGIKILLSPIGTNAPANQRPSKPSAALTPLDSSMTDSTGAYFFGNVSPGTYEVAVSDPWIQGKDTVLVSGEGELLIDVNIAVVLNASLSLSKQGPAQRSPGDTALYNINARNSGALSLTHTLVVDTLDSRMIFIDASSPGSYESAGHRIVWNTGIFPAGSQLQYAVRVAFADTLHTAYTARNVASITSDETTPTSTQAFTRVDVPSRLHIWKTSSVSSAQPGDTVTYAIVAQNAAGETAESIRISDALPAQVRFLSSAPLAQYDSSAHLLRWLIDSLRVGQAWQVAVKTIVRSDLPAGEVTYANRADLVWRDSSIMSSADSRSHAQVTTVVSYLQVSKQALRKVVEIGDLAGYVIRVTNTSTTSLAHTIVLVDRIPFGFSYVAGSSVLDSMRIADPTGRQELRWHLADSLPPNTTRTFSYRLVVGAGGAIGTGVNTAQAFGTTSTGSALVSAAVSERVEVRRGVFTDRGLIVGKVFYDDNRNAVQDEGEEGVKNVELMMEDGTRIITGDDGKYSLPDVPPGQHVIKVRQHTLPEGAELLPGYGAFAHDPTSRFVKLTESNVARADFYLQRKAIQKDSVNARLHMGAVGTVRIQRITEPRNVVFIEDDRRLTLRLKGFQADVGKAPLRQSAMNLVREVNDILRDYPDQHLWIAGHSDPARTGAKAFPSDQVLGLADAKVVQQYLVDHLKADSTRISIVGFGPDQPMVSNSIPKEKTKGRRIEFNFSGSTEQQQRSVTSIVFHIPISYEGTVPVQRIVIHDVLDTLFQYADESATLGDQPITPQIDGRDLYWTVNDIGISFKKTLTYRVTVHRPLDNFLIAYSQSCVKYVVNDSMVIGDSIARTANTIGIAGRGKAVNYIFPGVLFEADKTILRPIGSSVLNDAAEALKNDPGAIAIVVGHTDSRPMHTPDFTSTIELSRAQAAQIVERLVTDYGIARERFEVCGWGAQRPVASNATAAVRQANRRVEIRIYKKALNEGSIHEGFIDSSSVLQRTFTPNAGQIHDTLLIAEPGGELLLKLETYQRVGARTRIVLIDSLNSSLVLTPHSVRPIRGIDSTMKQDTTMRVAAASMDSVSCVIYRVAVLPDIKETKDIQHFVYVEIIYADGTASTMPSTPVTIRIRQKH